MSETPKGEENQNDAYGFNNYHAMFFLYAPLFLEL